MLSSSPMESPHGVGWEDNTNATQKPDSRLRAGFEGGMVKGNWAVLCPTPQQKPRNTRQTRAQDKIKSGGLGFESPQKNTYIYRPLPFPPSPNKTLSTQD